MKRILFIVGMSLAAMFLLLFLGLRIWCVHGIKENIRIAKAQYGGIAEDALLAYLSDTNHSAKDRTDVAIWTLGQIRSEKALPVLKILYKDDPGGETCKYSHDTELCQYEINKAIVSIEHGWMGAKEKNWLGSWARLNK